MTTVIFGRCAVRGDWRTRYVRSRPYAAPAMKLFHVEHHDDLPPTTVDTARPQRMFHVEPARICFA
ncbi:MAG: hypothetical protein MJA84_18410 [Firmicutes bacterium]|nr:hypothetical protein [Bacillota bacterium]